MYPKIFLKFVFLLQMAALERFGSKHSPNHLGVNQIQFEQRIHAGIPEKLAFSQIFSNF